MRLQLRSLHNNPHRKRNRSRRKKKNLRRTRRKRRKKKKLNQRKCTPKKIWQACAAMECPSLGKINRRALPPPERARETRKRKRPSCPCPARTRNTGAGKAPQCS